MAFPADIAAGASFYWRAGLRAIASRIFALTGFAAVLGYVRLGIDAGDCGSPSGKMRCPTPDTPDPVGPWYVRPQVRP